MLHHFEWNAKISLLFFPLIHDHGDYDEVKEIPVKMYISFPNPCDGVQSW